MPRLSKNRHRDKSSTTVRHRRAARLANLRYVLDDSPGIRRRRSGTGFQYRNRDGKRIRNAKTLSRIAALVIPPAWDDVWICPRPDGHLQATGRDSRGRKQYRYHDRWRAARDDGKYHELLRFARSLPRIRRRVAAHVRLKGLPKKKVLAGVVKLLETTLIRVGNDEYAKSNESFGLTTMRDKHVKVRGPHIRFVFQGKSGIAHEIDASNRRLARLVGQCQHLPGRDLFQYVDDAGTIQDITSTDVNEYLREISGEDFTAKEFRTWAGTVLAARALKEFEQVDSQAAAKRNVRRAIERVADRLGNTAAVCKKCYVHPAIIDAYMDQGLIKTLRDRADKELRQSLPRLTAEEGAVLALLKRRLRLRTHRRPKSRA